MWARKRTTGRVEHFWYRPYVGQVDVWQQLCVAGMRDALKIRKTDHEAFFVPHPSGSQRCKTCLRHLAIGTRDPPPTIGLKDRLTDDASPRAA